MIRSAERLDTLAGQTGFQPQALEKVIRLGEVAADIARHPLLSRACTSIRRCSGSWRT